jgi:hypothetical protein
MIGKLFRAFGIFFENATESTYIKIPNYSVYLANHPDNQAHAGAAVIIRTALKHYELQPYIINQIQSPSVKIQLLNRPITIAALYSPPRHSITVEEYKTYLSTLGQQFIVAGDWNAKNTTWGSRITTKKGRNLLNAMTQLNITHLSTGEPHTGPLTKPKSPTY